MYETLLYRPTPTRVLKDSLRTVSKLPRLATGGLRTLPDFLIIGAQRAGTSSLYAQLCRHPAVIGAFRKELHYFDLHHGRGVNWYRAHLPLRAQVRRRRSKLGTALTGEATPYYLHHPSTPRRVAALLPEVKLIVMLRNPIDRALSHYHHEVRCGFESLSFEEAIQQEPERLAGEDQRLRRDGTAYSEAHLHHSYLARGRYAGQLEGWLAHFDRDRILMLSSEDYFTHPGEIAARAAAFLGLPPSTRLNRNATINKQRYPPMADEMRRRLGEHFRPHNQRLYDLLGIDFGWER